MANATLNDHGDTLISWKFPEVPKYSRSRRWYVGLAVFGLATLAWSIYDRNFLFAVIIVLSLAIIYFQSRQEPRMLSIEVTEDGLAIGKDFFVYDDIKNFWIIYTPPVVKTLYLSFKSSLRPILGISLEDANPVEVRKHLLKYLAEDLEKEDEPASDAYGRLFKI
ncbi:MAG: hypothetical protein HY975_03320 [Candidatus Kerfeldbacteria bacterium]|nr:hypothetical protein [Candidatus Kerfeldbacteria bacterium]